MSPPVEPPVLPDAQWGPVQIWGPEHPWAAVDSEGRAAWHVYGRWAMVWGSDRTDVFARAYEAERDRVAVVVAAALGERERAEKAEAIAQAERALRTAITALWNATNRRDDFEKGLSLDKPRRADAALRALGVET